MNGDESGVRVSNREIYDVLVQLRERVTSLEGRVDSVLSENVDLRKRTRALELKVYTILSGLVTMGGTVLLAMARGRL